jgi:hypothetical protein
MSYGELSYNVLAMFPPPSITPTHTTISFLPMINDPAESQPINLLQSNPAGRPLTAPETPALHLLLLHLLTPRVRYHLQPAPFWMTSKGIVKEVGLLERRDLCAGLCFLTSRSRGNGTANLRNLRVRSIRLAYSL